MGLPTHCLIFPSIGHSSGQTDVQTYLPLRSGGSCAVGSPPTCTAIAVSDTEWRLHGHQTYYVTIKAENSAGLSTLAVSEPYVYDVQLASEGLVFDIQASVSSFNFYIIEFSHYMYFDDYKSKIYKTNLLESTNDVASFHKKFVFICHI